MASLRPFFTHFAHIFLFFVHLGCFVSFLSSSKKEKSLSKTKPIKASISSSWNFVKGMFSSKQNVPCSQTSLTMSYMPSPASTTRSFRHETINVPDVVLPPESPKHNTFSISPVDDHHDLHPCHTCGEIFRKPTTLQNHQLTKHVVSELLGEDSGKIIILMIFNRSWPEKIRSPNISRVLRIHNSHATLARFEEYREFVKAKAARNWNGNRSRKGNGNWNARCIADGNEMLRFHCTTFCCGLEHNGYPTVCNQQYCSLCGIIKNGFSAKLCGISTTKTSYHAHIAVSDDVEEEFEFMNVKRAVIACRVVAGRVGLGSDVVDGYDSVVVGEENVDDELMVFNHKAVLPCFVIVYTV